ncbi:MAG: hypothetical protein MRERV_6c080 [Mycoplasmataceae bacterium RV_VA103A]|nr:MAG: hypothetical protein MRERV_6c080 [Mycoplasmataceae bacterium RV_VA103A]
MEVFIEHLLNLVYHYQRQRLAKLYQKEFQAYASSYIRFGGWEISYNGKGRTHLGKETAGNLDFISKTIYLHVIYSHWLVGISVPQVHDFSDFLDTMAHELAHCLLGDFDLDLAADHEGGEHKQLTREILEYLEKMPEVKELERLQRNFKKVI